MKLRNTARTVFAAITLLAMLSASVPALAAFFPSDMPNCCNSPLCPMPSHKMGGMPNMMDCAHRQPPGAISMMACDTTQIQAVGIGPFVLRAPLAVFLDAVVEKAPSAASRFSPFTVSVPLTPPPRALPS